MMRTRIDSRASQEWRTFWRQMGMAMIAMMIAIAVAVGLIVTVIQFADWQYCKDHPDSLLDECKKPETEQPSEKGVGQGDDCAGGWRALRSLDDKRDTCIPNYDLQPFTMYLYGYCDRDLSDDECRAQVLAAWCSLTQKPDSYVYESGKRVADVVKGPPPDGISLTDCSAIS